MRTLYLFIVLLIAFETYAQTDCPCFNVVPGNTGCAPYDISVQDCSGGLVTYQYEPSKPFTSLTTHSYTVEGTYVITQKGNFTCGGLVGIYTTTRNVTVKPVPIPAITSFACANNKAFIIANDPQYDEYQIINANNDTVIVKKGKTGIVDISASPIQVKGNYTGAHCGGSAILNTPGSVSLPAAKISKISKKDDNSIDIAFDGLAGEMYEIQMKDNVSNTYSIIDTVKGPVKIFTASNLKDIQYCFRLRTVDYCGQTGAFSNEVCSVILKGNAIAEKNNLNWSSNTGFSDYDLKINDQSSSLFKLRAQVNSFSDTSIKCGNSYCYQINATTNEAAISESNKVCLTAISKKKPESIKEVTSDVISNSIILKWNTPLSIGSNYTIVSSSDKSQYNFLATTGSTFFTDASHNPSVGQICYKLALTDNCGNPSDYSLPTCPVYLNGVVNDALSRKLFWQPYIGWEEGVKEYFVEKVDGNGNPYSSVSVGNTFAYTDSGLDTLEQVIHFRIKALSNTGKTSYSNIWDAFQKGNFSMPNAFTPNGDGLNDVFHAEGLFITTFSMEIWNRNGEGVFSTKSFKQGWDGKINGQNAPVDTYMYKIEAIDKLGTVYKRNGSLQLIK